MPRWARHISALLWFALLGIAVLAPAFVHGGSLGPFDILSRYGLSQRSGVAVHDQMTQDQITEMLPWLNLTWTQIHHGQLPLWNSFSGLGMPLAFNWQSGAFSLPAILGYLVPLHLAFAVQMFATLVIAGSGVYVLSRVLGLSGFACVFAGTVFELSGPIMSWLGWPIASVAAWTGWLFAAAILVIRGDRRWLSVTFFAAVLAAAIYAGQPDVLTVILTLLAVFVFMILILRIRRLAGSGPILRPTVDLFISVAAGLGLAAPLALPAVQLTAESIRTTGSDSALPPENVVNLLFQNYDGLPIGNDHWFGTSFPFYPESAAYIGVIVVVLAVIALVFRWRTAEVKAFLTVAAIAAILAFVALVTTLTRSLPELSEVHWHRSLIVLVFTLVILSGVGMDVFVRRHSERAVLYWLGGLFGTAGLVLLGLWFGGKGGLSAEDLHVRAESFAWPTIQCVVGLALVTGLLLLMSKPLTHAPRLVFANRGVIAGLIFFGCETLFLVVSGFPLISSSSQFFPTTPAITELKSATGNSLVGWGVSSCLGFETDSAELGIVPESNDAYGIQEFAMYDPSIPRAYYTSWAALFGHYFIIEPPNSQFCPGVKSAKIARLYGISYVLEPHRAPGPLNAKYDKTIGNEDLYYIPDSGLATLTPLLSPSTVPSDLAPGTPVRLDHPTPAAWKLETDSKTTELLRLRVTAVPGVHATIDGEPLKLTKFAGVMLQARIPPGKHVIRLYYWPEAFTAGLVVALLTSIGLISAIVVERKKRRAESAKAS
jgi:hypothetical protein